MTAEQFNIEEVFEIAQQIERNGVRFYSKAASLTKDQNNKLLLLDLVDMEEKHERVFANLQEQVVKQMADRHVFDPDSSAVNYLQSYADGLVFDYKADPTLFITEDKSLEEILTFAIGMEKESILFYYGLQELVPEEFGKSNINTIIKEELKHITFLSDKIKALSS